MGKTKQTKKNEQHKTIPSSTKRWKGEYKVMFQDTEGEEMGGFFMDMADIKIIYNALKQYTPTEEEDQLHEILLETFDEEIWTEEHQNDEE